MASTLIQMGSQASSSPSSASAGPSATVSAATGSPAFPTTLSTPPYLGPDGRVLPYLRFVTAAAPLSNGTVVVDLVMPLGEAYPGAFYMVQYTCNGTPALT